MIDISGPGVPPRSSALLGVLGHELRDLEAHDQVGEPLADERVVEPRPAWRSVSMSIVGHEDVPAALVGVAHVGALVHERWSARPPAVVDLADAVVVADAHVGEEDLVEVGARRCICRSGRTSTPGACMSTMKTVMPRCLGASGSVRQTHSPSRRTCATRGPDLLAVETQLVAVAHGARGRRSARSEPAPGSLNSWQAMASPRYSPGRYFSRVSRLPCARMAEPMIVSPKFSWLGGGAS